MARTERSSYYDMPESYQPVLTSGIKSQVEQRFQAVSASKNVIRFRLHSSSPRALMENKLRLRIPLTFRSHVSLNAVGGGRHNTQMNQAYLRGNFARALESVTIEINNTCSISYRNEELGEILDDVFAHPINMQDDPEGALNSYIGRDRYRLGIPMQNAQQAAVAQTDMVRRDRNAEDRLHKVPATAANTDFVTTFVHDLQIPGLFAGKWRMGKEFGSLGAKKKWLPYMDTISLTLIFRNESQVGQELFQCPSYLAMADDNAASYNQPSSVPTWTFRSIDSANCYCDVRYLEPADSFTLPAQVRFPSPRFVVYSKEAAISKAAYADFNWTQIRLESSPLYFLIYCSLKNGSIGRNPSTGTAFQSERFRVRTGATFDERTPGVLQITSSAAGGLTATLSARTLYEITMKNQKKLCPGKKCITWEQWKSGWGCYILLSPDDLGSAFPPASVFAPSVLSCKVSFEWGEAADNIFLGAHAGQNGNVADGNAGQPGVAEAKMVLLYSDNLVISSGAASVSSTMVAASALRNAAASQPAPVSGIEKLAVDYPGQD